MRSGQERVVREICTLRVNGRGLETGLTQVPRQPSTLPPGSSASSSAAGFRNRAREGGNGIWSSRSFGGKLTIMFRIVEVHSRPNHKLWLRFEDGVLGEVDVSHLAGRGVFSIWNDPNVFASVSIDDLGNLVWQEDIELCADSLYLRLTGKKTEEIWGPKATRESA